MTRRKRKSLKGVRHDRYKAARAWERTQDGSGSAWKSAKILHVEVAVRRVGTSGAGTDSFQAVACPASTSTLHRMKSVRHGCRGAYGKTPTAAYRGALRELSKVKR